MSSLCTTRQLSCYEAGRIVLGEDRVFRPGGLELTARAIAFAGLGSEAVILDLGCGAGASVRHLRRRGFDAIGIDCEGTGKQRAMRTVAPQIAAHAEDMPFPDGAAEGILAECSLSLMPNQDRVLKECARVLTDGGCLMISDLYAREPAAIAQVRALNSSCVSGMIVREELEMLLARCGFTVDLWEDHSQALRECAARFTVKHGSLKGLWGCGGEDSAETIQRAMCAARAGYFLLMATRRRQDTQKAN